MLSIIYIKRIFRGRSQACWDCRNMDLGAFLHSPLMAELEALEKLRRPSVSRSSVSTHRSMADAADISLKSCASDDGAAATAGNKIHSLIASVTA